ncbi:MAG: hypothetical protein MI717_10025 [Spirochaetales bacterium]|nr:hypothetical protein [Spirochaetales bacterium]
MNNRLMAWGLLIFWTLGTPVFGQNTLERISSSGIVRIGIPAENFPPYYQKNEGGGWDGEIFPTLFQLASWLQATPVFVSYPQIATAQEWLKNQSLDVFLFPPGMETSEIYTFPFYSIPMKLLVSRTSPSSLNHLPVVEHDQKSVNKLLLTAEPLSHESSKAKEQRTQLHSGAILALITEEEHIHHFLHSHPAEALTLRCISINAPQSIRGAVSSDDDFFLEWLSIALEKIQDSNRPKDSQRQGEHNE